MAYLTNEAHHGRAGRLRGHEPRRTPRTACRTSPRPSRVTDQYLAENRRPAQGVPDRRDQGLDRRLHRVDRRHGRARSRSTTTRRPASPRRPRGRLRCARPGRRPRVGLEAREAADLDRGDRGERPLHDLRRAQAADRRLARRRRAGTSRSTTCSTRRSSTRSTRRTPSSRTTCPKRIMTIATSSWMPVPRGGAVAAPASRSTDSARRSRRGRGQVRHRPAGHRPAHRPGVVPRPARALGLRQVDDPAHPRRPRDADDRRGAASTARRPHELRARQRARHRVPGPRAAAVAQRRGEHPSCPSRSPGARPTRPTSTSSSPSSGCTGFEKAKPAQLSRRHAPARRRSRARSRSSPRCCCSTSRSARSTT